MENEKSIERNVLTSIGPFNQILGGGKVQEIILKMWGQ